MLTILGIMRFNTARIRAKAEELSRLVDARTAELQRSQRELNMLANLDSLTCLPNRRMFIKEFENMRAMTQGNRFSLLLIDFDKFKEINDTYGHDAGDAFLIAASHRLKEAVRGTDHVARLGGDEFAILLAGDHDEASMEQVCQRIIASFASEVYFKDAQIATSASVGVAIFPQDGASQEELYKAADLALYEAKRRGRNNWYRHRLPRATPAENSRTHPEAAMEQAALTARQGQAYSS